MYSLEFFKRKNGKCPVEDFLDIVDKRDRTKITSWLILLEERGHLLIRPYTDTARGKIRYLRIDKGTMCYRLFYFFDCKKIIITNGYIKKTQKLDESEIETAENFRKEYFGI